MKPQDLFEIADDLAKGLVTFDPKAATAMRCMALIEAIRQEEEGVGIEIYSPNADVEGPNEIVSVCASWTSDYTTAHYRGDTLVEVLTLAHDAMVAARKP